MGSRGYEQVSTSDPLETSGSLDGPPLSPPPPFRSTTSIPPSQRRPYVHPRAPSVGGELEDAFNANGFSEADSTLSGERERLIRDAVSQGTGPVQDSRSGGEAPPAAACGPSSTAPPVKFSHSNDGVFANLSAKPESGEKVEEQPPSYEQAAADATPPYWETTILAPGMVSDEIYIDGLPVGSFFSFAWNGVISMAFQLVGFLLTYILHTTHAAKNGSRAGLGITLINYGFTMRSISSRSDGSGGDPYYQQPVEPDNHDFDPSSSSAFMAQAAGDAQGTHATSEWVSYLLMICGWIILIKAVTDYIKARRHEQLILQSPERGVNGTNQDVAGVGSIV